MAILTGEALDLTRARYFDSQAGMWFEQFDFEVNGSYDGIAHVSTNIAYEFKVGTVKALELDTIAKPKFYGVEAVTRNVVQCGEVNVHVNPNGAGVMEATFNFPEAFKGSTLPVMTASVVRMDGATTNAHLWKVVPTVLSSTQFKLKVINTTNTWGTDIAVQYVAMTPTTVLGV